MSTKFVSERESEFGRLTTTYFWEVNLPQAVLGIARHLGHLCGRVGYYDSLDNLATLRDVWAFDARMGAIYEGMHPSPDSPGGILGWELGDDGVMRHQTGGHRMLIEASDASIAGEGAASTLRIILTTAETAGDGSHVVADIVGTVSYIPNPHGNRPRYSHEWSFRVEEFRPELLFQQRPTRGRFAPGREAGDPRFDRIGHLVDLNNILGGHVTRKWGDDVEEYKGDGELVRSLRSQPDDANAAALLAALDEYPARMEENRVLWEQRHAEYNRRLLEAARENGEEEEDWPELAEEPEDASYY